jgi:hypothetical protein
MKKNLFLMGMLTFIFTFLSLPLAGTTPGTVQAQTKPNVANFQCIISNIATVQVVEPTNFSEEDRIYVQCANSPGGNLSSFASAVGTNPGIANRYLVVLNTAVALGKTVTVFYDISSANNPVGCQSFDCRKLTGLVLGP